MNDAETEGYASVWDAIADTPQEAANLRVRSELMNQISALIQQSWLDAGGSGPPLRRNPTPPERLVARSPVALLARRAGEHRGGPRLSGACGLGSSLITQGAMQAVFTYNRGLVRISIAPQWAFI